MGGLNQRDVSHCIQTTIRVDLPSLESVQLCNYALCPLTLLMTLEEATVCGAIKYCHFSAVSETLRSKKEAKEKKATRPLLKKLSG